MDSISQLRKICQESFAEFDPLQAKLICRPVSIYITWILLHTGINAMQVTWVFLILGFIPGILFASSHYLSGAIILQIWYIFDCVDGEIARYRKESSLTGVYFDYIIHYIIHPYIFAAIGYGLYKETANIALFIYAVSAAISVTVITALSDAASVVLFDSGVKKKAACTIGATDETKNAASIFKKGFSILHKLCTYPSIMNIITATAIIDAAINKRLFAHLIIFYGIACPVVWTGKLYANVHSRKLDR